MHRTNPMPKLLTRGLRTALVLVLLLPALARAQEARPSSAPTLIVSINGTQRLQMSKKQVIAKGINDNDIIVRLAPVWNDPRAVLVTGLEPGIAHIKLIDEKNVEETFEVIVQLDVEYLRSLLKRAVPSANIAPIPGANNTIILTGTVARPEDAEIALRTTQSVVGGPDRVINALRVGGVQHVQLSVVMARVNRSLERQFGFSFVEQGTQHFLTSTVAGSGSHTGSILPGPSTSSSLLTGTPNLILGIVNDKQGFLGLLNALRTEGVAKFLNQPTLVTLSGQEAYVVSGGEVPILTASLTGQNVSYKTFGTVLHFLPLILDTGRIMLQVRPEVSNRNAANDVTISSGFGTTVVPGFDTQTAWTAVELEPGQTLTIGGLINHTVNTTVDKIPVLGELPFIGAAFSNKVFTETEEELVILVTPHLVAGMSCDQLPKLLPGLETRTPDDFELFLEGILEAPRGPRVVCRDHTYVAPWKNGPTASGFPCAGNGTCGMPGGGPNGPVGGFGLGALLGPGSNGVVPSITAPAVSNAVPPLSGQVLPPPTPVGPPKDLPPVLKNN